MYYYAHHLGKNKNQRDKYKDHEYFDDAINFCEKWDQASFDPDFKSKTLEEFAPMVKRIFSRKPYSFSLNLKIKYYLKLMINSKEQIIQYFESGIKKIVKISKLVSSMRNFLFNKNNNKRIDYSKIKKMFKSLLEIWLESNSRKKILLV